MKKKVLVISIIFAVLLSSFVYGKSDDSGAAAEDHTAAEDKRIQAAQDYPNVSIHYPWDE